MAELRSRAAHGLSDISRGVLRIAGYVWTAPCSLVGLVLTIPVLLRGGTVRVRSGVVEVALPEITRKAWFPYSALTLGHVVLGRSERVLGQLRAHEYEHVLQYERWGVFFFLAYPLSSLTQVLRGRSPYWFNHFEVQARERSAHADRDPDEERIDGELD